MDGNQKTKLTRNVRDTEAKFNEEGSRASLRSANRTQSPVAKPNIDVPKTASRKRKHTTVIEFVDSVSFIE